MNSEFKIPSTEINTTPLGNPEIVNNKQTSHLKGEILPNERIDIQNTVLKPYIQNYPDIKSNFIQFLRDHPQKKLDLLQELQKNADKEKKVNKIMTAYIEESITSLSVVQNITENSIKKQQINTEKQQQIKDIIEYKLKQEDIEKTRNDYKRVLAKHSELNITPDSQAFQTAKSQLGITEQQRQSQWLNQQLSLDEYISRKASQSLIKANPNKYSDPETKEFLSSFKSLESSLPFWPLRNEDVFLSANTALDVGASIFDSKKGNQNLISATKDNTKNHDYATLFETGEKDRDTLASLIQHFGKFIKETKKAETIITNLSQNKVQPNEEQLTFLSDYKKKLFEVRATYETLTKDALEQMNTLAPVIGMSKYMNINLTDTPEWLTNFQFDQNKDIKLENDILTFSGEIQGHPFTLRQNLNGNNPLETSDIIAQQQGDKKTFKIWAGNFQPTAYELPGKTRIWQEITDTFTSQQTNAELDKSLLARSSSLNDYQNALQIQLFNQIKNLYGNEDLVQSRMEKQIQKDLASQELISSIQGLFLDGNHITPNIDNSHPLSSFFLNFDTFLEHSVNPSKIQKRRDTFSALAPLIQQTKEWKTTNLRCDFLKQTLGNHNFIKNTQAILAGNPDVQTPHLFTILESIFTNDTTPDRLPNKELEEFSQLMKENNKEYPNQLAQWPFQANLEKKLVNYNLDKELLTA